jgi:hypothetical protein
VSKQNILLAFVIILAGALCIAPFALFFGIPLFNEWRARQSLRLIEGAHHLFDDLGLYGGSSSLRSTYYWSDKPVEEVRSYYQTFTTPFIMSEDEYGTWEIALIKREDTIHPEPPPGLYTIHGSFCNYRQRYNCISVAIADAGQPDLYRLPISSPTMFRRSDNPPEFDSLPQYGTLIIYSYYVYDF